MGALLGSGGASFLPFRVDVFEADTALLLFVSARTRFPSCTTRRAAFLGMAPGFARLRHHFVQARTGSIISIFALNALREISDCPACLCKG